MASVATVIASDDDGNSLTVDDDADVIIGSFSELMRFGLPDLAGKAQVAGELTADSTTEQSSAGLDQCTPEEYLQFQDMNQAYHLRFGFPFVMAVRDSSRAQILAAFEQRLGNDREVDRGLLPRRLADTASATVTRAGSHSRRFDLCVLVPFVPGVYHQCISGITVGIVFRTAQLPLEKGAELAAFVVEFTGTNATSLANPGL